MPVVKSYRKLAHEVVASRTGRFEDIDSIICSITDNILSDSPGLVSDAVDGEQDGKLLESAVTRDIESNRYNYGIFRDELILKVMDYILGYGELQRYIEDEDITDIDGMRFNQFSIKRHGVRSKIPVNFGSIKMFDTYCRLIIIRNGGILHKNESCFRVADEKYRLRISVSIYPGNITGPVLSIRKHRRESYRLEDLKELGMLDDELTDMLRMFAAGDTSVVFCGRSTAGKTTLLRAFINCLPEMEQVFIVESEAEIYPDKLFSIEQQIRRQNENSRAVTLKELIREALTLKMDTYCIGEISGEEASEFVKATFFGYKGIASMQSESAEAALDRLLMLGRVSGTAESDKTTKEMLGRSINAIFYMKNFRVVEVLEVVGYDAGHDAFAYRRLYLRKDIGVSKTV